MVRPLHPPLNPNLTSLLPALITATPYFLTRLEGSSLKSTFSSYLSTTFTVANFAFLAHATATTKQVRALHWFAAH